MTSLRTQVTTRARGRESANAFKDALVGGVLKLTLPFETGNKLSPTNWMYMYTKGGFHYFKNIEDRSYIKAPSPADQHLTGRNYETD